ncbi:aldo/keto reductase [Aliiglaciecola sp. 3_MG-2023]|uniref:aldo/keto reductase n=1 Tax=Aliiglaciecola sp. 3_MG-2023 TaxID=3062644 RepID=UPI0026E2C33B|nr:aldo/keto reductase [Aliiglaciecola sp. 3_MG-2023]MDO6695313.1 aldo/keto reductase [Aliiglaciecola sp. 3_MG-2023]
MTKIATKSIGNTELQVPMLGFGGASLGNLYQAISDSDARFTVQAAIKQGIQLFDTAPRYGLGLSERRLGDALRTLPKSDYFVSTKVGRMLTPDRHANVGEPRYGFETPMPFDAHYDYTYSGIMRSYEDSLQRLGLAQVDILLVHDIGKSTHGDKDTFYYKQFTSSGYRALDELRSQGSIKAIGLGVNETEICERVMDFAQFDCFLLAGRYSLIEQDALTGFLPKCEQHGASIILGGPYNSGILATGVKGSSVPYYNYQPAPKSIIEKVAQIEAVCAEFNVNLPAAALQFPLAHTAVATVIPGIDSAARMEQTIALFKETIPQGFWLKLKAKELIHAQAPLPKGNN